MTKVNKKLEVLTKQMDEVFLDKEEYWKEVSYEEGAKAEKINISKNLLNLGISIDDIKKATGLTKEEIENL